MIQAKKTLMHPLSQLLCEAYNELRQNRQVSFPLEKHHKHNLDSVVKTVNASYFCKNQYNSLELRAVAYLCHIIKRHPVMDGNKRLSILWFETYCESNNLSPDLEKYSLDVLAVSIAETDLMNNSIENLITSVHNILFG